MRVKCMLFPGEVLQAKLVQAPSQATRGTEARLELVGPAPMQLDPPSAMGTEVVEATAEEWAALRAAGYQLPQAK